MFRNEHLPFALYVGIKEADFWNMNPRLLRPYNEAYKLKMEYDDQLAWMQGQYVLEALLSSVGNMFKKKGAKPYKYPDKPRMTEYEDKLRNSGSDKYESASGECSEKQLSEDEKKRKVEKLFLSLRIMQANFNNSRNSEAGSNCTVRIGKENSDG